MCDGHPFVSDLGIILVTSPEFPGGRDRPTETALQSKANTQHTGELCGPPAKHGRALRSSHHFIWQLAVLSVSAAPALEREFYA